MKAVAGLLLLLVLLGAGLVAYGVTAPYAGFGNPVLIDFPMGTSSRAMAQQLADKGVVRSPLLFLMVRALRPGKKLQAGEYEFSRAASPWMVFDRMARGDIHHYEVTIPEGSNRFDVARIAAGLGFFKEEDFHKVAADPALIRDLDPKAESLEGYLFPSTYRVTKRTTAQQFAKSMTDQFRAEWKRLKAPPGAQKLHEAVTMASLVEKETGVDSERPVVASVYYNRLAKGMRLECDPTTIYAAMLENRYRGTIYRSDLANTHPYNTYQHTGLPPGPIANPGRASLEAALRPASTEFIFFVAKPDSSGGHRFSQTLAEHDRAVADYRRGAKKGD